MGYWGHKGKATAFLKTTFSKISHVIKVVERDSNNTIKDNFGKSAITFFLTTINYYLKNYKKTGILYKLHHKKGPDGHNESKFSPKVCKLAKAAKSEKKYILDVEILTKKYPTLLHPPYFQTW